MNRGLVMICWGSQWKQNALSTNTTQVQGKVWGGSKSSTFSNSDECKDKYIL